MNNEFRKNIAYHKPFSARSGFEEDSEDSETKQVKELVDKLEKEVQNINSKTTFNTNTMNNKLISTYIKVGDNANLGPPNKSNFSPRAANRAREDRNDREFLLNFLSVENKQILPKTLHLLSDNDTNHSISHETKLKNLANLMMDSNESSIDTHLIRNYKEKLI